MEACIDSGLLEQIARVEQCHCDVFIPSFMVSHDQWYEHFMMTCIGIVLVSSRSSDSVHVSLCPDLDLSQFDLALLSF